MQIQALLGFSATADCAKLESTPVSFDVQSQAFVINPIDNSALVFTKELAEDIQQSAGVSVPANLIGTCILAVVGQPDEELPTWNGKPHGIVG